MVNSFLFEPSYIVGQSYAGHKMVELKGKAISCASCEVWP